MEENSELTFDVTLGTDARASVCNDIEDPANNEGVYPVMRFAGLSKKGLAGW